MGLSFDDLKSSRLRLRRIRVADAEAFAAYRGDPAVARYQSWSEFSVEDARQLIDEQEKIELGAPGRWCQMVFELLESGELAGDVAFCRQRKDPRQMEVGFNLAPAFQGRGLATEAVTAFLDDAFHRFDLHRVFAITDAENLPAARLLERLGFRREAHLVENIWFKGKWGSELLYAVLAREWSS